MGKETSATEAYSRPCSSGNDEVVTGVVVDGTEPAVVSVVAPVVGAEKDEEEADPEVVVAVAPVEGGVEVGEGSSAQAAVATAKMTSATSIRTLTLETLSRSRHKPDGYAQRPCRRPPP